MLYLQIPHYGTIVINGAVRVGKNCRMHVCTNIGVSGGSAKAPELGDNIYLGPGVKIYGEISLSSKIKIAPNSVVF